MKKEPWPMAHTHVDTVKALVDPTATSFTAPWTTRYVQRVLGSTSDSIYYVEQEQTSAEYVFEVHKGNRCLHKSTQTLTVMGGMEPTSKKNEFESSPGKATDMATPLGNRIPLILVHGCHSDKRDRSLNYWKWWLEKLNGDQELYRRFKVYRYVYDSRKSIWANGLDLAQFINTHAEVQNKKLLFLAHSMGGLVARTALIRSTRLRNHTLQLVTLGTPHLGSPGANPTWVYATVPIGGPIVDKFEFLGSAGEFNLAWYKPSDMPPEATSQFNLETAELFYDSALLQTSIADPLLGRSQYQSKIVDRHITAIGGQYRNNLVSVDDWADVLSDLTAWAYQGDAKDLNKELKDKADLQDHYKLYLGGLMMRRMIMSNAEAFDDNDGLVPLLSALLGPAAERPDVRRIDLTAQTGGSIDHACYLDVPWVINQVSRVLKETASDSDGDGLLYGEERVLGTDPENRDSDGDGLPDGDEGDKGTDPSNPDTDRDGLPDGWEVTMELDPTRSDERGDPDGDGLTNIQEFRYGTNPRKPDTDNDGLPDPWEVEMGLDADRFNPGGDPDGDGLTNIVEYQKGTHPLKGDTDGDGMSDGWEVAHGLDPKLDDGKGDPDGDLLTNASEYGCGTNPQEAGSVLKFDSVARTSDKRGLVFSWRSVDGKRYRISYADALHHGSWTILCRGVPATGGLTSVMDTSPPPHGCRFYQLQLEP